MTKVYPNSAATAASAITAYEAGNMRSSESATVLTVWSKSLLMSCSGFTVFDASGNIVFRVDNYMSGHRGEIVLMDACGKPLHTIRRKRLSLGDTWVVYDGETSINPRFSMKKNLLKNSKCLAQVNSCSNKNSTKSSLLYQIEGSFEQRSCSVFDNRKSKVAEIKRKEAAVGGVALGVDVFSLVVQPNLDTSVAMAFVILLDQMYSSRR